MSDDDKLIDVRLRFNQHVVTSKTLLGIKKMVLSARSAEYYLNFCK